MTRLLSLPATMLTFVAFCQGTLLFAATPGPVPATVLWDGSHMASVLAGQRDATGHIEAALRNLETRCEKAVKHGPYSVVTHGGVPPSGDRHDYESFGTYWWPNPDTTDGLPYIRRDGVVNVAKIASGDKAAFGRMNDDVFVLSVGGYFLDEPRYSRKATALLRCWFLDEATRMNPNLNFGQAIPGRTKGRCYGIIDTKALTWVTECARLLRHGGYWSAEDDRALQAWMGQYLIWLRKSTLGREESATKNNHATYYDCQVAALALYVGDRQCARQVLEAAKTRRIGPQIEPDGRQLQEIARTRGLQYSTGNWAGFCVLARLGENVGVDLWNYKPEDGGDIRKALNYLLPYLTEQKAWPHEQLPCAGRPWAGDPAKGLAFHLAAARYGEPAYLEPALDARGRIGNDDFSPLLYPSTQSPGVSDAKRR